MHIVGLFVPATLSIYVQLNTLSSWFWYIMCESQTVYTSGASMTKNPFKKCTFSLSNGRKSGDLTVLDYIEEKNRSFLWYPIIVGIIDTPVSDNRKAWHGSLSEFATPGWLLLALCIGRWPTQFFSDTSGRTGCSAPPFQREPSPLLWFSASSWTPLSDNFF